MLRVSLWRVKSELPPPARGERATMTLLEDSRSVPAGRTSAVWLSWIGTPQSPRDPRAPDGWPSPP